MDQPPLPEIDPYVNRNLFSDHFLKDLLPQDESWQVDEDKLKLAMQGATNLYAGREEEWSQSNEAQLERKLVRPMLGNLGHCFEVQTSLPTVEGRRWPDYTFFATDENRREALDFAGAEAYFSKAIGIGDAKRWGQPLGRAQRPMGDKFDRLNPSWQIDYYLRMSGARWAILTNGRVWRLYNKDTSFRLDIYYEIDLPRLLGAQDLEAFKHFYLFFRREAFVADAEGLCFLDRVYQGSLEYAQALGDDLKENVYKALRLLAEGFLRTGGNDLVPARDLDQIHANSLVLLYRLLFINYAEDRRLLPRDNRLYKESYGLVSMEGEIASKLQRRESLPPLQVTYWGKLRTLFNLINQGTEALGIDAESMQVPPYNGGLFNPDKHPFLEQHRVEDRWLAQVIDLLARSQGKALGRGFVDYSSLDVRHLGSIYEGLLEYKLLVADDEMVAVKRGGKEQWIPATETGSSRVLERVQPGSVYLATDRGERKATGSYYTPDYIVKYILEHTVGPLIEEKMKEDDPIEGVLSLKILDPAMGSGHFLVEATDRLAHALVEALGVTEQEPEEEDIRWARREVVERCIYGVDVNPLAVELAKLSLWLHTVAEGKPLSFLDHHLKVGNSLIGAWVDDLGSLPAPRKRGKADEKVSGVRQMNLFETRLDERLPTMLSTVLEIMRRGSETLEDIKAKTAADHAIEELKDPFKAVADLWVSTYFGNELSKSEYQEALEHIGEPERLLLLPAIERAREIAEGRRFFHWQLEFPEVFYEDSKRRQSPGFDAVVGNPPYDVVEKERLGDDDSYADFGLYLRRNEFFKAASGGKQNLFRPFLVTVASLSNKNGQFGQIVPLAILTDSSCTVTLKSTMRAAGNLLIQAFPQKDNPNDRVFPEAKLSTCILIAGRAQEEGTVVVATNPGRMIVPDAKQYSATYDELKSVSGGEVAIPLASSEEWELTRRLRLDSRMQALESVVELSRGEINQTIYRPYITDNPRCQEMLKGCEIAFYQEQAPSQGLKEWFDSDLYRRETGRQKVCPAFRIALQRITGVDDVRRLTGTVVSRRVHFADSLNSIAAADSEVLGFALALLNSRLLNWCFGVFSTNNNVSITELASLPIPRIGFSTPPDHRGQLVAGAQGLYDIGDEEGLVAYTGTRLASEPEQADVIHDLLAYLAERMIQMNKQKETEANSFLDWLASYTGLPIDDWRLKTVVKACWQHPWDQLGRALRQNRKAIQQASGRNVEGREARADIQREFDKSTAKLDPLLKRIAATDRLIDLIVYRLYRLTQEEIAIIEGGV